MFIIYTKFTYFVLNSDNRVKKFGSIKFEFAKNLVRLELFRVGQNSDPSLPDTTRYLKRNLHCLTMTCFNCPVTDRFASFIVIYDKKKALNWVYKYIFNENCDCK